MIKLIVLDIDGTIMRNGKTNPEDILALKKAMDQGIVVTLASGRSSSSMHEIAANIGIDLVQTPIIGQNGGQVFYFQKDLTPKFVYRSFFVNDETNTLFELAKNKKVKLFAYTEKDKWAYVNVKFHPFIWFMKKRSHRKVTNFKLDNPKAYQVSKMVAFGSKKKMNKFRKEVEAMGFPAFAFSYVSNAAANIEIVPKGINKSIGLAKVAELLKINQNEVLYFGDGENDIEAIQWAGTGVAMGNAKDKIKNVANDVTLSFYEAGVAHYLNEQIFKED
ncbi:HAD superfamily hydrolase [Williamsoniiplasma somnilux]|uniref:HAD superfamily hydrolase n=1 Tax=Williamsoniiplasma somnilux TaxID=215578 RepID=A0A2K8P260_9MOLU|nr:Cof-type HAD-IIB family hydrolase [Williamsoniiplasma somnilux]ATZ18973.1 HAD superfamily hydrolase [Williamsoniiplasma somnilux]